MNHTRPLSLSEARDVVRCVEVRLVAASERSLWNSLMKLRHYLGFHSLIGQSLKYVAVHEERWLSFKTHLALKMIGP